MATTTAVPGLQVEVAHWPGFLMPRNEVIAALSFLAHKKRKAVRCTAYRGSVQYSADFVNVYICTSESCQNPIPVHHVKIAGTEHALDDAQAAFKVAELGEEIKDDEGRPLALVDHNCLVILIDITAANNEAARAILSHVVARAIPLLDFDVKDRVKDQQAEIVKTFGEFYTSAVRSRIDTKTEELHRLERDTENFYYQLVQAERDLPLVKDELDALEKQAEKRDPELVTKQAAGILALITTGQYEEVSPANDGSLFARTSNIIIEHDDWTFELGRYEININAAGKITIFSADGKEAEGYPHPHVDSSGRPCFGNISADLARAVGRMRLSEALTLLHDYLSSYNPDGPYIRIGKFDPEYNDPDEDPCDDCEDYHSPYCICECSHNDGNYSCSDCGEYRSDYCYQECSYNTPGFQYISPCDSCEESEKYCFLECQYNQKWEQNNPCSDCKKKCDRCEYAEKKKELASQKRPARAAT